MIVKGGEEGHSPVTSMLSFYMTVWQKSLDFSLPEEKGKYSQYPQIQKLT